METKWVGESEIRKKNFPQFFLPSISWLHELHKKAGFETISMWQLTIFFIICIVELIWSFLFGDLTSDKGKVIEKKIPGGGRPDNEQHVLKHLVFIILMKKALLLEIRK